MSAAPQSTTSNSTKKMPQCWGHRGASADFPENTLASFESAARTGSDGIESDLHITADDHVLMFHDPHLGRTTIGGSGCINDLPYKGVIENLRTAKKPHQRIPLFEETMQWFVKPENQHLVFNLDIKPNNNPDKLFTLVREVLERVSPDWKTLIAPRVVLGLWHPSFVEPALRILPELKRAWIGMHLEIASCPIMWDAMDGFSIAFAILTRPEGRKFLERCRREGKEVYTWTVNAKEEWAVASELGVDAIITDKPMEYAKARDAAIELKSAIPIDDVMFFWKTKKFYALYQYYWSNKDWNHLLNAAGPITPWLKKPSVMQASPASTATVSSAGTRVGTPTEERTAPLFSNKLAERSTAPNSVPKVLDLLELPESAVPLNAPSTVVA